MKRKMTRVMAMMLAAAMALGGCSSAGSSGESAESDSTGAEQEAITDLVLAKVATSELATFNLLSSETSADTQYLTNIWDGLLEVDNYGELAPCIAEDW